MEEENKEELPIGAEMRQTSSAVKNYIDIYLRDHLKEKLTGIEGMVLGYIFHHHDQLVTSKNISFSHHAAKATVSQTLTGLKNKGYIKMEPLEDDKRNKVITLTEKGEKVHAEFDELFLSINKRIEEGLKEEDKKEMRKLMKKIRDNLSK
jgi:DNA-binding MarR family transcriptional regulator